MKEIIFITSSSLATNPRIVKEINLALEIGYLVKTICFRLNNWGDEKSREIEKNLHLNPNFSIETIDAKSNRRAVWLLWGALEKIAQMIFPIATKNIFVSSLASSRRSIQLHYLLKNIKVNPSLIIAHNLPSLYPAFRLSKKHDAPFIFDIEDYHPGEIVKIHDKNEKTRREFLMRTILPKAVYLTAASELIAAYSQDLIKNVKSVKVLLNAFPTSEFHEPKIDKLECKEIRFIWFSQNISMGRGLEELLEGLNDVLSLNFTIKLYLQGVLDVNFKKQVLDPFIYKIESENVEVIIIEPVSQYNLHKSLANYDVGLALEMSNIDINKDICLSNKMLAYYQSGLFILATNTAGQKDFIGKNSDSGLLCKQNSEGIKSGIKYILENFQRIESTKVKRFQQSKETSWDTIKPQIEKIWYTILN